ncbi:T-cell immunomodulatory protein-like [Porphyridium purpureum]|uniref:T-cell immunomodulatory protein-like n=1 Tax=Porphyridium purpureum TaxID=35688 RepID=A0A5J4YQI1_PORPP|nr:T-cell immunomodulatory protein-like [Porphyridium purpureum]|eukprot:POR4281..scf236_6
MELTFWRLAPRSWRRSLPWRLFLCSLVLCLELQSSVCKSEVHSSSLLRAAGERGAPVLTPEGFSDQTAYVGLDQLGDVGALVAFGDFSRDMFLDLVLVNPQAMQGALVAVWDHENFRFVQKNGIQLPRASLSLASVASADFNNDGILDILAVADNAQAFIFYGDGSGSFTSDFDDTAAGMPGNVSSSDMKTLSQMSPNFLIFDANGDLKPDILSIIPNRGAVLHTALDDPGMWRTTPWNQNLWTSCSVVNDASPAFVDLNGDCLPDLLIPSSCGLHVWLNAGPQGSFADVTTASSTYKLIGSSVWDPNRGDGRLAFADFNGDGTIDIAFHNVRQNTINVLVNVQRIRTYGQLCEPDPHWALNRLVAATDATVIASELSNSFRVPPTLRVGDFNYDGLPDLVVVGEGDAVVLYGNTGRWGKAQRGDKDVALFKPFESDSVLKDSGKNAIAACFFDTDESGRQDILVLTKSGKMRLIWNNYIQKAESLFFKGTALSALPYFGRKPPPFAPVPGATFKLSFATPESHVLLACSQCPESSFLALQTCNCFFGLVRISNYIEQVALGTGKYTRSWENLMPNSVVVVWPQDAVQTGSWWIEYFTQRRGGQMLGVVIALCVLLLLLAISIYYLFWKEFQEDRLQKYGRVDVFNFRS